MDMSVEMKLCQQGKPCVLSLTVHQACPMYKYADARALPVDIKE